VIVDSSALLAILRLEPEAGTYMDLIRDAPVCRMSAANVLESGIVIDAAADPIASRRFDDFLASVDIVIEPVSEEQARLGRAAYRDFGRGSGHPAQLNFGDCFAYALAKAMREPLLFKGADFGLTDVTPAA